MREHFLHHFFNAASIAIIGATENQVTLNYHLVENLLNLGYQGKIYPVNPKSEEILGIKAYKSFNDIGTYVDLVVISIPAHNVLETINDLPGNRVGGVVLVTGGFSETGEKGKMVQDEIARTLKLKGIRAIGPNTLSPVNSRIRLIVDLSSVNKLPRGNVSFIFQSGMYVPRFNWILSDFHLGISKLIDLGNKMDINEVDALEYLSQDPETSVICLHLEVIKGGGRKFLDILKQTTPRKPIIVLKGGRTESGARAAMSHTGSLVSGSDAIFDFALRQVGATKVDTLDDFLYLAKAFSYLKPPMGNRIALAAFPGGEAVLAVDMSVQNGLMVAQPGKTSYDKLRGTFPAWEVSLNPYDFGVAYTFSSIKNIHGAFVEAMADDENVDCLAIQLPPMDFPVKPEDFCPPFLTAAQKGKPLAVWPPHMLRFDSDIITWLEAHLVPVFPSAAISVKCLAALYKYGLFRSQLS